MSAENNPATDFKDMVENMTSEMLICTVAAIVIILDQIIPNAEQAITSLAGTLIEALEAKDEQSDQGATE